MVSKYDCQDTGSLIFSVNDNYTENNNPYLLQQYENNNNFVEEDEDEKKCIRFNEY